LDLASPILEIINDQNANQWQLSLLHFYS